MCGGVCVPHAEVTHQCFRLILQRNINHWSLQNENQVQSLSGISICPHYQGPATVPEWHQQAIPPMQVELAHPFRSTSLPHLRQYYQSRDEEKH